MESMLMDQGEDSNAARANLENAAPISCPAGTDDVNRACDMCHDQFEQFFNEETEEWHLRSALKVDEKFYHPICYEDFKVRFLCAILIIGFYNRHFSTGFTNAR